MLISALLMCALVMTQTQSETGQTVKLDVLVLDSQNHPVSNLRPEDFRVLDGGKPQAISFFSDKEVPLSYGLVIDSSGSMKSQITKVIEAAETIINGNRPGDETFIIDFIDNSYIHTTQEFTRNKSSLIAALNSITIGKGATALIDALYLSAQHLKEHKTDNTRRALILVTDGEERNSYYSTGDLFKLLRGTNIQIFIIGFVGELDKDNGLFPRKSSRDAAVELLDHLAKETGGRTFYPKADKDIQSAADEIMLDLRSQYVLGFVPAAAKDKQYRKVEVTLADADKKKRIVITRPGYTISQKP